MALVEAVYILRITMTLIESIKHHEGFVKEPYPDPLLGWEKPTFGYGFTWITEDEAEFLLAQRITYFETQLKKKLAFWDSLPHNAKDVLIEMAYQMDVSGVLEFKKMLKAMQSSRWDDAIAEMRDSKWYQQTPKRVEDLIKKLKEME